MSSFRYTEVPGTDNSQLLPSRRNFVLTFAAIIAITTRHEFTKLWLALTGDTTLNFTNSNKTTMQGDEVTIMLSADGSARTVTFGTGFSGLTASTIVCGANKSATWTGVFDGTNWIEISRSVGV